MPAKTTTRPDVLFLGPAPHLAHCIGCGELVPMPPLPTPVTAFCKYLDYAREAHRACRPKAGA